VVATPTPQPPLEDEPAAAPRPVWPPGQWSPVMGSPTACCCAAGPVVQIVLPPAAGREPVELLLCGHHFRASRDTLTARDPTFFDVLGGPLGVEPDAGFAPTPERLYS
jgi:hypothetical protein